MTTCSVDGCEGSVLARSWCSKHYARWRANGDPLAIKTRRGLDDAGRLWFDLDKSGDCWLWKGSLSRGYGMTYTADGRTIPVHRLAYEVQVGPIPEGMEIDHLCHVASECNRGDECPHRRCVRGDHLAAVTTRENVLRSNATGAKNAAKTHCPKGHPYAGENLVLVRGGASRGCRECMRAKSRRENARKAVGRPNVTEVNAAKTHCVNGHEFTPENTYVYPPSKYLPNGSRACRSCIRIRAREYRARKQSAKLVGGSTKE